jgi:ABC-2 type transport system ATP-binding protein
MSVQVQHLTKEYGTQKAVNDLSFTIAEGEVVGLLGPNGAGKSTTMKILTCFIPQTSGTATVCGFDVASQSLEVRRQVGYLPESNPLYFDMYVKEYLLYAAGYYQLSQPKQHVDRMIELVGLGPEQTKKIGQLSKGYKQRVGLAQALIHDPKVLILDEPTSGLDPNQLVDIRQLINEVGKKKTVILSTHIMQEVEAMCQRVIIINKGQLVDDRSLDQLPNNQLLLAVRFAETTSINQLKSIPGVIAVTELEKSIEFLLTAAAQTPLQQNLFAWAVQKQLTVVKMEERKTSLEDLFREKTQGGAA